MKEGNLKQFVSDTLVDFSIENAQECNFAHQENGLITGAIKEGVGAIPTGAGTVIKSTKTPIVGSIRGGVNTTLAGALGGGALGAGIGAGIGSITGNTGSGALLGAKIGAGIGGVGGLVASPIGAVSRGSWDTLDRVGNSHKKGIIKQLGTTATAGLGAGAGAILGGIVGNALSPDDPKLKDGFYDSEGKWHEGSHTATGAKIGAGLGALGGIIASKTIGNPNRDTRQFINPNFYYVLEVRSKDDIRLVGNKMGYANRDQAILRGEDYDAMSKYNVSVLKGSTVLDYYPEVFKTEYTKVKNFSESATVVKSIHITKKRDELNPNDQLICIGRLKVKNSHKPTRSEANNRNWLASKYEFSILKDKDYFYSANSENEAEQVAKDVLKDSEDIVVKLLPAGDYENKQTLDPIGRSILKLK